MVCRTIRDVARQAGVSIATVSRVMRDSDGVRRRHPRPGAGRGRATLEFVPSQLGRQLAERRHAANGIVFPDLSGPYYAEVVLGYEAVAAELGRSVLILSTHGRDDAESAVRDDGRALRRAGRPRPHRRRRRRRAAGRPRRPARRWSPARRSAAVDSVNADNRDSAVALAEHLLGRGARGCVFVGDPSASPDVAERWAGVQEASDRRRPTVRAASTSTTSTRTAGARRRRRGCSQPGDAARRLRLRQRRARARPARPAAARRRRRTRDGSRSPAGTT